MNKLICTKVYQSDWFTEGYCDYLCLEDSELPYQIFEKIFLNVAAKCSTNWRQLLHAEESQSTLFVNKVTAVLLVEKYLKKVFEYNDEMVEQFFDIDCQNILLDYRRFD